MGTPDVLPDCSSHSRSFRGPPSHLHQEDSRTVMSSFSITPLGLYLFILAHAEVGMVVSHYGGFAIVDCTLDGQMQVKFELNYH
jgi:hypothetical protein